LESLGFVKLPIGIKEFDPAEVLFTGWREVAGGGQTVTSGGTCLKISQLQKMQVLKTVWQQQPVGQCS